MSSLTSILNTLVSWLWTAIQWLWNFYISIPFIRTLPWIVQVIIFVVVFGGAFFSGIRASMGGGRHYGGNGQH
jgi:hypothetical protein